MIHQALTMFQQNKITAQEAVEWLLSQLDESQAEIASIKYALSMIAAVYDDKKLSIKGLASISISKPSKRTSYKISTVDSVLEQLYARGITDLAQELENARKVSPVAGSLKINRKNSKKG